MARRASAQGDDRDGHRPGDGGPLEAATFIAESVGDLTKLAHRHQLDVLGFLLDMALLEARDLLQNRYGKRRD